MTGLLLAVFAVAAIELIWLAVLSGVLLHWNRQRERLMRRVGKLVSEVQAAKRMRHPTGPMPKVDPGTVEIVRRPSPHPRPSDTNRGKHSR